MESPSIPSTRRPSVQTDRYSRQVLFPGIGVEGQQRLAAGHIAVVGCGAGPGSGDDGGSLPGGGAGGAPGGPAVGGAPGGAGSAGGGVAGGVVGTFGSDASEEATHSLAVTKVSLPERMFASAKSHTMGIACRWNRCPRFSLVGFHVVSEQE